MGRAIDVDNRLDKLEHRINEVLLILDELSQTNSKQKQVDLHEETKPKKSENKNGRKNKKDSKGSTPKK